MLKKKKKKCPAAPYGSLFKADWIIIRTKMVKAVSMRNGLSSEGGIKLNAQLLSSS